MLRVSMISAKAGMKLAMPVFHPESPSRVLLRSGFELDSRTILRLRELQVRAVWISYPPLSFLLKHASPEVIRHRASVAGHVHGLLDDLSRGSHADLEYSSYARTVSSLSQSLIDNPDSNMLLDEVASGGDDDLEHACSVCFIAVLMGLKMGTYLEHQRARVSAVVARDVTPLGVAGMLHDVGMTQLPEEVRQRWRETRDESDLDWQKHVEIGFHMVHGRVPPAAAAAVLHHHQAYDGSGFPYRKRADGGSEKLRGGRIHIYARILAAADIFDRMSRYKDASGGYAPRVRILNHLLRGPRAKKLDPMVMRALLAVCPPYPPGTLVRLSDGTSGVVVGWEPVDPCRPRVMIVDPSLTEESEPGEIIELAQSNGLCVVQAEGQDVGRDNFYPINRSDFCLETASKLLHNAAELERHRAHEAERFKHSA
ncbi:MAG: HD-GYP domain-containing protein [Phycisphaerales bacterium JB058]